MISIDLSQLMLSERIAIYLIFLAIITLIVGIISMLYSGYYSRKLSSYLKEKKPNIWKKRTFFLELLTNLRTFDPAVWSKYNPFQNIRKMWQYIFNDQDTIDSKVLLYKQKIRSGYRTIVFSFLTFIVLFVVIFILLLMSGGTIQ